MPLKQVLQKPDFSGRLVSWLVELTEYAMTYKSRGAIKGKFLADFVAELTPAMDLGEAATWVLSVDGSSHLAGSGAGIVPDGPGDIQIE